MSDRIKLERCICGKLPQFVACQVAEDAVQSQFVYQTGTRIPGGGFSLGGCGKEGPEVEDANSDRETAADSWNAMIRAERKSVGVMS